MGAAAFFEKKKREPPNTGKVTTSVFNYLLPEYKL
jgi:hypothetical protein